MSRLDYIDAAIEVWDAAGHDIENVTRQTLLFAAAQFNQNVPLADEAFARVDEDADIILSWLEEWSEPEPDYDAIGVMEQYRS